MNKLFLFFLTKYLNHKFKGENMMSGWKTWLGALSSIAYGIFLVLTGKASEGLPLIIAGISLIGIGHKIDKSKPKA